jgi:hypothetical protein
MNKWSYLRLVWQNTAKAESAYLCLLPLPIIALCLIACCCAPVYAESDFADKFQLSGFGTLALGRGENDYPYDFNTQETDTKYDNDWTFKPDSRLGLQLDIDFSEQWFSVIQAVARLSNDVKPELAWGLVGWRPNDKLTLRIGRMRVPFYLYSDYADLGFAYPWITVPKETYFIGVEKINAANVLYDFSTGNVDHQIEAYYGQIRDDFDGKQEVKIKADTWGLIWKPTWQNYSLRLSYHHSENVDFF